MLKGWWFEKKKKIKQVNAKFARTCTNSTNWAAEILADFTNCTTQKKPTQHFLVTLLPFKLVLPRSAEQQQAVIVQLQPLRAHLSLDFRAREELREPALRPRRRQIGRAHV